MEQERSCSMFGPGKRITIDIVDGDVAIAIQDDTSGKTFGEIVLTEEEFADGMADLGYDA